MDKSETVVGRNIIALRREKKMKKEALATALDITVQQLYNYETGRTRISEGMIVAVAGALGVTVERLFNNDFSGGENVAGVTEQ